MFAGEAELLEWGGACPLHPPRLRFDLWADLLLADLGVAAAEATLGDSRHPLQHWTLLERTGSGTHMAVCSLVDICFIRAFHISEEYK